MSIIANLAAAEQVGNVQCPVRKAVTRIRLTWAVRMRD